jgi:hypothetical protein
MLHLAENTGVWIRGASPAHIINMQGMKQRKRQIHVIPPRRAAVLLAAYHAVRSLHIFRYAPRLHHDNQSKIFASKCNSYL